VSLHLNLPLLMFCLVYIYDGIPVHGLLRDNRLREKFPAGSFSGRPILSEAGFGLLNSMLTYDPDKVIQ
jgi:hypothetical protein